MATSFLRKKKYSVPTMIILGIIILSFIFWTGVSPDGGSSVYLTKVNGEGISYREYQRLLNQQLQAYGQIFGSGNKMNESLEQFIEQRVAGQLITRKLLSQQARDLNIVIGQEDVLAEIQEIEAFQDPQKKRFSPSVYQAVLRSNGLNPRSFEESLKEQLEAQRMQYILQNSVTASNLELQEKQWLKDYSFNLQVASISAKDLRDSGKIKITPEDLQTFYDSRKNEFKHPEKRKLEVARFNRFDFRNKVEVSDEETKEYFETEVKNSDEARWKEKRAHAFHILVSDTSPKGKAKIEQVLSDLKKERKQLDDQAFLAFFKRQAKQHSEDYASASKGGDLGYFNESAMVDAFSKAVFESKTDSYELIGPIQSDFGYHLIVYVDRTSEEKSFDNRKTEITETLADLKTTQKIDRLKADLRAKVVGTESAQNEFFDSHEMPFSETAFVTQDFEGQSIAFPVLKKAFESPLHLWQEPIEFEDELFVFRVLEIEEPQPKSLVEATPDMENLILSEKVQNLMDELYQNVLTGNANFDSLKAYGAEMTAAKKFSPFKDEKIPGLSNSTNLIRSVQGIYPDQPVTRPILNQGKWVMMMGSQFTEPSLSESSESSDELLAAKRGSVIEDFVQQLVKDAKMPEEYKKQFAPTNEAL